MKTIRISGKDYQLNWVTGDVLESSKNMETKVSGGGGSFSSSSYRGTGGGHGHIAPIVSTTTVHDQIFIKDDGGKEYSFQLQNIDVACRCGNKLSVIWEKNGQKSGPYVAVINHSTSEIFYDEASVKNICQPIKNFGWIYGISFALLFYGVFHFAFLKRSAEESYCIYAFYALTILAIILFIKRIIAVQKFKDGLRPDEFK